jgi:adenine-specific DNA methylase
MIPKECKRLAEVDFPIAVVSAHAAREKSIRHGHPSTLHLWWARRPLASCRAMLLALLLPDPCDAHCPPDFKDQARSILKGFGGRAASDAALRQALLGFIGDVANWDVANHPRWIGAARDLVKAAHPEEPPLVVDPFAGGGSIPLEALRLGCDAFASDLNPVACLIEKVLLEDIPRHGPDLAEELRKVGAEVKVAAEKELAQFYPIDPDGARPIAYLWARTVRCEAPHCGAEIPLVRSFWLSKKATRRRALKPVVVRPKGEPPRVEFTIFEPATEKEVSAGTVTRAKATYLCCNTVLGPDRVRAQLRDQRGGADVVFSEPRPPGSGQARRTGGARLLAVVTLAEAQLGRQYRPPTERDYQAVWKAKQRLEQVAMKKLPSGLSAIPDEPTPGGGGSGAGRAFSVQKYGMMRWADLFTARQKIAAITIQNLLQRHLGTRRAATLAISVSRIADRGTSLCRWDNSTTSEVVKNTFSRQALPILWDFAEVSLPSDSTGNFSSVFDYITNVIDANGARHPGQVQIADAAESPLTRESVSCWFTDPPYYDAIPYSDLSDFFLVWLKRTLPAHPLLRDPFDPTNPLTPKLREAVQDETKKVNGRPKDREFFEETMAKAFAEGRRVLREDGIGSVVFAHKTTEGWEALLSGMIRGGWTITGSWPISTEMATRLRARDSAALATSVHLVCRPRPEDAGVGDWGEVLRELPKRVRGWMDRLEQGGVHGADLVFACIGPALEIFSRHARVETAEGDAVTLDVYLQKVWEVVGRTALERVLGTAEAAAGNGAAGALEEDARLTALFLWTLQATDAGTTASETDDAEDGGSGDADDEAPKAPGKGFALVFDVVRRFAQPLGIHLETWEGRIIQTTKGVVPLLPVAERARQLFGADGASAVADRIERMTDPTRPVQLTLFATRDERPDLVPPKKKGRRKAAGEVPDPTLQAERQATTLDRVHAAMLLQAGGRTSALRALLRDEMERGPDFIRLANSLAKLYPDGSEEKRLVQAMLLATPRR